MKIINFYKIYETNLFLPTISLICNKILEEEQKVVISIENEAELKNLDEKLWTFSQSEFLPHLAENSEEFEEFKEETPILLSTNFNNIVEAENLIILNPVLEFKNFVKFNRIFFVFDGTNAESLTNARLFWKQISSLKEQFTAKFYEQTEERKWVLKV